MEKKPSWTLHPEDAGQQDILLPKAVMPFSNYYFLAAF